MHHQAQRRQRRQIVIAAFDIEPQREARPLAPGLDVAREGEGKIEVARSAERASFSQRDLKAAFGCSAPQHPELDGDGRCRFKIGRCLDVQTKASGVLPVALGSEAQSQQAQVSPQLRDSRPEGERAGAVRIVDDKRQQLGLTRVDPGLEGLELERPFEQPGLLRAITLQIAVGQPLEPPIAARGHDFQAAVHAIGERAVGRHHQRARHVFERALRSEGVVEIPGDQAEARLVLVLVQELVVVAAAAVIAIKGRDPVPVGDRPVDGDEGEELVDVKIIGDDVTQAAGLGHGQVSKELRHQRMIRRLVVTFERQLRRVDRARPLLLVQVTVTFFEVIMGEAAIDVLDVGEEPQGLAVHDQPSMSGARGGHPHLAEQPVAEALVQMAWLDDGMKVEPLEAVETQRRLIFVELDLHARLRAGQRARSVRAAAQRADPPLEAQADLAHGLAVDAERRLLILLLASVGLQMLPLLGGHLKLVGVHLLFVEDPRRLRARHPDRRHGRLDRRPNGVAHLGCVATSHEQRKNKLAPVWARPEPSHPEKYSADAGERTASNRNGYSTASIDGTGGASW